MKVSSTYLCQPGYIPQLQAAPELENNHLNKCNTKLEPHNTQYATDWKCVRIQWPAWWMSFLMKNGYVSPVFCPLKTPNSTWPSSMIILSIINICRLFNAKDSVSIHNICTSQKRYHIISVQIQKKTTTKKSFEKAGRLHLWRWFLVDQVVRKRDEKQEFWYTIQTSS